jgi:hypothetical protein
MRPSTTPSTMRVCGVRSGDPLQQKRNAAGVAETGPAEARGADPRLAPQGVHLETRVVGQREVAGEPERRLGLEEGVALVGVRGLVGKRGAGHVEERDDHVRDVAEQRGELPRLVTVQRREDEPPSRG